jgi:hypothetical protein
VADAPPRIIAIATDAGEGDAHMGAPLHVILPHGAAARLRGAENRPLLLVLNGNAMPGIVAQEEPSSDGYDHLRFDLERTADNHDAWAPLLGRGKGEGVVVSVQGAGGRADPAQRDGAVHFRWWKRNLAWLPAFAIMIVTALALILPLFTTAMYRDPGSGLIDPVGSREHGTFSLARCQLGFWFLNVVVAYTSLWAMTGATDAITSSVLAIIGIGSGTLLGASLIDQPKRDDLDRLRLEQHTLAARSLDQGRLAADVAARRVALDRLAAGDPVRADAERELEAQEAQLADARRERELHRQLCSGGLTRDLLTDENGWSFHRVQLVVWTLVLFVLFWASMVHRFAMPDFDTTLLSLMGISSGTYLGLKMPENSQRPRAD